MLFNGNLMDIFKSAKWYKNTQPIAVLHNEIIAYKKGKIIKMRENQISVVCKISFSITDKFKESSHILKRLFRKEIRCVCYTKNRQLLFFKNKILYCVNLLNNNVHELWKVPSAYSTPLNITASYNDDYLAFWGDYFGNSRRDEVNIYGINHEFKVKKIYTFPQNSIRHIHNIIEDGNKGYYIFTGDDDKKAGIYHADEKFKIVEPIYVGDKQARSVVGFALEHGILFATDSVTEINHVYFLYKKESNWCKDEICRLNGSCIYGVIFNGKYIFSTTVESPETYNSKLALLSRKLGSGILSDYVEIVSINDNFSTDIIGTIKKDNMPYKLFQYGSIRFPYICNDSKILAFYPVSVRKYDSQMGVIW